ncbi:TPA: hypothetical protein ACXLHF_004037 [Klebsiella pneumoniae]
MTESNILEQYEAEDLQALKNMSDVLTRDTSRRLDEINSHLNAIDLSLEAVIEMYNKAIEERDEVLIVSLVRIANKYRDQFVVWKKFLDEDTTMVAEIAKRFSQPTDVNK